MSSARRSCGFHDPPLLVGQTAAPVLSIVRMKEVAEREPLGWGDGRDGWPGGGRLSFKPRPTRSYKRPREGHREPREVNVASGAERRKVAAGNDDNIRGESSHFGFTLVRTPG